MCVDVDYILFPQTSEQTNLYMTSCAKDDVEDAIKFIKEHVYIKSSDSGEVPAVYTTGVGCNQMAKRLNNELNIRYSWVFFQLYRTSLFLFIHILRFIPMSWYQTYDTICF